MLTKLAFNIFLIISLIISISTTHAFGKTCSRNLEVYPTENCGVLGIDKLNNLLCHADSKNSQWRILSHIVSEDIVSGTRSLQLKGNNYSRSQSGHKAYTLDILEDELVFYPNSEAEEKACIRIHD